jgi:hypothetical protein
MLSQKLEPLRCLPRHTYCPTSLTCCTTIDDDAGDGGNSDSQQRRLSRKQSSDGRGCLRGDKYHKADGENMDSGQDNNEPKTIASLLG